MRSTEAASRYAKALYELARDAKRIDPVLNELREFATAMQKDKQLHGFLTGPLVSSQEHAKALETLFGKKQFSEETKGLLTLLARKRRFELLADIATSFQSIVDEALGVARGQVYSATTLFPEDRQRLEITISKYTAKKAVLEYHEDKSLLGGLVAKVGSYTFDDSLETQLRLMKEDLKKRRSH
jgi:F-type H+-transporting ATPase subunit delta